MDQWLKTGTVNKRKTTESTDPIQSTQNMPSSISNLDAENSKTLPQVSDTKLLIPGKIRKYSEEYLWQGFSSVTIDNVARPECVVCGEVLSNFPFNLTRVLMYHNWLF
jgi:hypothetical protein